MSATYNFWCFVEGDNTLFYVSANSTKPISVLQTTIKERRGNFLKQVDAPALILSKVHDHASFLFQTLQVTIEWSVD
jgi:hypothetical protein